MRQSSKNNVILQTIRALKQYLNVYLCCRLKHIKVRYNMAVLAKKKWTFFLRHGVVRTMDNVCGAVIMARPLFHTLKFYLHQVNGVNSRSGLLRW